MKKLLFISAMSLIFLSCKHEKNMLAKTDAHIAAEYAASRIVQNTETCTCISNGPNTCGGLPNFTNINMFMNNLITVTKTITWNNCLTSPYSTDPGCNEPLSNVTTQLKLCWRSCSSVTAEFTGTPSCLPCFPSHFCIALTPSDYVDGSGHHLY